MSSNRTTPKLVFPVLVIEQSSKHKYSTLIVAHSSTDFVTFTRLPGKDQYRFGWLFDAGGQCGRYEGTQGPFIFEGLLKNILETLIVPSLVTYLTSMFVFSGPRLVESSMPALSDFKALLIEAFSVIGNKADIKELTAAIAKEDSYEQVIAAFERWQFHGGIRDEDGHLLDES